MSERRIRLEAKPPRNWSTRAKRERMGKVVVRYIVADGTTREAALSVARAGTPVFVAATHLGVSADLMTWRLNHRGAETG